MSIPNEALQRLLQEIEQKAASSQQEIAVVKAQIAGKNRDGRLVHLTSAELASLPAQIRVYEGVGRMFVMTEKEQLKTKLVQQSLDLKTDTAKLDKKLHYLETTAKNSRDHIERLLQSGARQRLMLNGVTFAH